MAHVTIYSTPTCVYCRMAKEFFAKNKIAYTEHDVASDLEARKVMFDQSHQMGVPVIDIDGKIIVGFDQHAVQEALGMK
jgi:glutaredoxin 3